MSGNRSLDDWGAVYERQLPTIEAFVTKLENLLEELVEEYDWVYSWTVDPGDFIARAYRALRGGISFENPLKELPGYAGACVIIDDRRQGQDVARVIEHEFVVNRDVSVSWEEAVQDDELERSTAAHLDGRPLAHYFVSIHDSWGALTEWRPYTGLWADIWIQTQLQRTLRNSDTSWLYDSHASYPAVVRDMIADMYRLTRSADERNSELRAVIEQLHDQYAHQIARGDLDVELSATAVEAYLEASETVADLVKAGVAAGLRSDDEYVVGSVDAEQGVFWLVRRLGIESIRGLDDFLDGARPRGGDIVGQIGALSTEAGYHPWSLPQSVVEWLLLVLNRADAETVSLMWYYDEVENAINTLIGNPVKTATEDAE